ncbi:hypothetical protein FHR99_002424 [Litorivivens lipolytica]|uniref:DUF2333 family protein n=1 Tax=Litorivivens lipolytica TaxID=1524264 RepID=A0A7W4W620_9GAMM|nr:DUF2333 family protein [Litorivivens lipolytica]MBB3048158.1 hypothetical protein [Litorivivens lipolytica]
MAAGWLKERWQILRENSEDWFGSRRSMTWAALVLGVYLLLVCMLGIYWSREPGNIPVQQTASGPVVIGTVTTNTLIAVSETLLDKPGGFLTNDITPPGLLLDNMPAWEYGVLIQVRDLTRAMRESFSRSQSQSTEDPDLAKAEPRFNFSNNSWAVPASESEYRDGIEFLKAYRDRLANTDDPQAQFYARADNLRYWLASVESRLGSLSQRLSASVGQRRLNTDLANETGARQSTAAPGEMVVKTPWLKIDDIFYEARGGSWALIHFLRAVERDFADVLANKNAQVSLRQIIRELEQTQQPIYSPMVLNGSGFGLLANHSLVMASYISRANAAIIDLRELLSKG